MTALSPALGPTRVDWRAPSRLRRLRAMSVAEIAFRGRQEVAKAFDRIGPSESGGPGAWLDAHAPALARPDTALRLQWGRFHQSDDVNELRVQDGVMQFDRPQRSDHLIVGLDHQLSNGVGLKAEAFSKRQLDPREHYENLFDRLAILPELEPDRVRVAPDSSELRGVELSVEKRGHPFSWWGSYTWAEAIDHIDSVEVSRSWDQRHAVTLGTSWQRGRWDAALVGTAHSGWPITDLISTPSGELLGARGADRVPTYFSVDMRVRYHWALERSDLALAFELTNALDHNNSCCRELVATRGADGATVFSTRAVDSLPLLPSFSVQWSR